MSMYDALPILGRYVGVNINSANTDYAIPVPNGDRRVHYNIIISNPSVDSSATWTYGVFSAAGGSGTILSNAANQRAGLATPTTGVAVSVGTATATASTIYFRVGTALGSAGTVDVTLVGYPLD